MFCYRATFIQLSGLGGVRVVWKLFIVWKSADLQRRRQVRRRGQAPRARLVIRGQGQGRAERDVGGRARDRGNRTLSALARNQLLIPCRQKSGTSLCLGRDSSPTMKSTRRGRTPWISRFFADVGVWHRGGLRVRPARSALYSICNTQCVYNI